MNISELSRMLSQNAESVAMTLFPNGKRESAEWCVGDISGGAGKSLKIHLTGDKAGIWCDFATSETGDLVDLWRESKGLTMPQALEEIKNHLGVTDRTGGYQKKYDLPKVPKTTKPKTEVLQWLTEVRKLPESTIQRYQLGETGNYVVFPFKFADKLRMCKKRNIRDKKDQKPTSANQEPCLFGWQAIPDSQRYGVLTEGELDAMALHAYGYPALSVPFGGGSGAKQGNWIENEFENLERFEEIFLCMDSDEAGQQAVVEIVRRLGPERCRVVTLPRKDANQCLIDCIDRDEIVQAFQKSKTLDPEELKQSEKYQSGVIKLLHPDGNYEPGFFSPWPKIKDLLYFRYSELTISNGVNGHGKSQVVGHISLAAMAQGERVCIASMELKPERLLARMTKQAGGLKSGVPSEEYIKAIFNWYRDRLWIYECLGTAKTQRLLETFKYAARRYGVKAFVVDSLMMCGIGEDDYNAQKAFVQALCEFKNEYNVHVFLVTHSRKGETEDRPTTKFDVKGTGAITDLADNVLTIWRNKKKENELTRPIEKQNQDILDMSDALLICSKQRNGDWEGKIALWYNKNCYQYLSYENHDPHMYVKYSCEDKAGHQ